MEHMSNVLLMMLAAERQERHGMLSNVQHMGEQFGATGQEMERIIGKLSEVQDTQVRDKEHFRNMVINLQVSRASRASGWKRVEDRGVCESKSKVIF